MKADPRFKKLSSEFWANVKLINQKTNYSQKGRVIVPSISKVRDVYKGLGLSDSKLCHGNNLAPLGELIYHYFEYRADVLNNEVKERFMNADEAKALFLELVEKYNPTCPLPDNKQRDEKAGKAYFTCCINILIQAHLEESKCCYDPKQVTSFTSNGFPILSLSRRVDGSFPSEVDPLAIWEIKEYYYTTTFGSRIADGIYETMLDGYELLKAREVKERIINHYLFTDAYGCWWGSGKSYLCRIVDVLHMGLLDEWIVGKEILEAVPQIIKEWKEVFETLPEFKSKSEVLTFSFV